jgi:ferritin-like metal-binding protein YciE
MEALVKEGDDAAGEKGNEAVVDAGIIAAAQRVEHYEIAAYGCLIRYAELIGLQEAVSLFKATLQEEKAADKKLTEVSDSETRWGSSALGTEAGATGGMRTKKTATRSRAGKREGAYAE